MVVEVLHGEKFRHYFVRAAAAPQSRPHGNPKPIRPEIMDPTTLAQFKKQLEEMEATLTAAVDGKSEATAPVKLDTSIGRLSRMDAIQSQQMALSLKARQQQTLMRVRNALQAIRNGSYGQCRRCKGPIAPERLEIQPDAVVCLKCAERIQS
jgi:DnaK suppressor protein